MKSQSTQRSTHTSSTSNLHVLIVGASGHLGSHISKFLCENQDLKLSLLVPPESKQKVSGFDKKITGDIMTFDVLNGSQDELTNLLMKDFTLVVNCMNFFDSNDEFKAETNLIRSCVNAGIKYYIPSDFSVDFRNVKNSYNLPRIEVRKKIHSLLNQTSQLKWISILCGVLIEKLLFEDCKLIDRQRNTMSYYGSGNEEFEVSTYDDVARFVSELISSRDFVKFTDQFITIYSEKITFKELGVWLKDIWGTDLKMNTLGSLQDLDRKIDQVKDTDKTYFYYLQYMKIILQNEGRIMGLDKEIWPNIQKSGVKNIVRQWSTQTSVGVAL